MDGPETTSCLSLIQAQWLRKTAFNEISACQPVKRELSASQKASLTEGFHLSEWWNARTSKETAATKAGTCVVPLVSPVLSWPICGYTVEPRFDRLSINGQIGSWSRTAPGTDASLRSIAINFVPSSPDYLAFQGLPGTRLVHGFPISSYERIPRIRPDRRLIVTTGSRGARYYLIKGIAPLLVNIFNLEVVGPF